ncbi:Nn.00g031580.m01.CDS01 [Neocucurbitaria sp. VM-36]
MFTTTTAQAEREEPAPIKVHWYHPTLMIGLFLCGFLFSVGHHLYYTSLDGDIVTGQAWVIRFGTVFAFLVKAAFLGGLSLSIKQVVWLFVSRKGITVRGLDAVFSITWDPTAFFVGELWTKTLLVALLAAFLWAIPLAVIVTPATITVTPMRDISTHSCDVPTLNFSKRFDWEYKSPQSALANFNITQLVTPVFPNEDEDSWRDHVPNIYGYGGPTPFAEKLFRKVLIGSEVLDMPSVCGPNCSYTITTPGLGYNCTQLDKKSRGAAIVNNTDLPTEEAAVYVGVLQPSRRLVGLVHAQETIDGKYVHLPEYFLCVPWEVTYELTFSYKDNIRHIRLDNQVFVRQIRWPRSTRTGLLTLSYPETNFWAYEALADVVGQHFSGGIWLETSGTTSNTLLAYSSLVGLQISPDNPNMTVMESVPWPKFDFVSKLEEIVRNVSISLMTESSLHIRDTVAMTCQTDTLVNRWVYNPYTLWAAYGSIMAVAALGTLAGGGAMYTNGKSSDVSFSSILCTTRNPTLDWAAVGARLGSYPLPKEFGDMKLRFGEIQHYGHAGFGREDEVLELKKHTCEARLA